MIPCISQATTLSTSFEADLSAYSRAGFSTVELWLTKLEAYLTEGHSADDVLALLETERMTPLAAATQGGLLLSRGAEQTTHWDHFMRRLELLEKLRVPTLVVAADFVTGLGEDDYQRAAASLERAGSLASSRGIKIALEFQKSSPICSCLETALVLIAQSGAQGVGVCLDLFHYYTGPSKFEDLAYLTKENLAWVQVSDLSGTPRELAGDGDRVLPGDGDFQLGPILDHLGTIGYEGGVSLEVLNPMLWQVPADRVADMGFQAVQRTLGRWDRSPAPGGL